MYYIMNNDNIIDIDTTVHKLDDYDFKKNATYTLLSSRRSGKSFMIRNLVYLLMKRKLIDVVYVFSYTADVDESYNWVAKEYIINPKKMDKTVELIMQVQKSLGDKAKKVCLVFDDYDITSQSDSLDTVFVRGRHYGLSVILSCQITTKSISPSIRNNTQYLFVRKLNSKTIKENVYNMLLNSEFDTPNDLYKFVKTNIENYQFILYLNDDDRPPSEALQLVKARPVKFRFDYVPIKK